MKRRLSLYGLRRSGNHAFVEWLIKNLGGSVGMHRLSNRFIYSGNCCYLNSVTEYENTDAFKIHFSFANLTFQNVVLTHEDCLMTHESRFAKGYPRIVIVRDILNVVASRYKLLMRVCPDKIDSGNLISINETIFQIWINHASSGSNNNLLVVQFEKWVNSRSYRDSISKIFNVQNLDILDNVSMHGGGSSFSGRSQLPTSEELNTRWKQVVLPDKFIDRINSEDIKVLRKKLGYIA